MGSDPLAASQTTLSTSVGLHVTPHGESRLFKMRLTIRNGSAVSWTALKDINTILHVGSQPKLVLTKTYNVIMNVLIIV